MPDLSVILPAAGTSSRYGRDKLNEMLCGQTVLERSLQAFLSRRDVCEIILIGRTETPIADPRIRFVPGGATRAESVRNGVRAISEKIEWLAIHDAARPLISQPLIDLTLQAAIHHGAAAPALPVHLTIKQAPSPLPAKVLKTVPRQDLFALQTPQILRRSDLLDAFEQCPVPLDEVTDDLQLLELIERPTWLVMGEERNLKITTRTDLELAKFFLSQSDNPSPS